MWGRGEGVSEGRDGEVMGWKYWKSSKGGKRGGNLSEKVISEGTSGGGSASTKG